MAKQYKVLVNTGKAESNKTIDVQQHTGDKGQPVRIKAQAGAKYQLQELGKNKNVAPDYVRAKRNGKNLEITFENGKSPDLIIEDYYSEMAPGYNGVIGQAENGGFYEYIPEDPKAQGLIPELADGARSTSVALGGAEVTPVGAAVAVAAFPMLGALGVLGAGAAAAYYVNKDAGNSTPIVGALASSSDTGALGDNRTSDSTPTLSGKVPAGATATVTIQGQTYPVTVSPDGSWTFTQPTNLPDGTYTPILNVTQNGTTTQTPLTPFTIDTVTNVDITNPGRVGALDAISGTAEPGDSIVVKDANGNVIGTTTAGADGQWSLVPTSALPSGTLSATAADAAGNTATDTATPTPGSVQLPTAPITGALAPVSDNMPGTTPDDNKTNDATPVLAGTVPTGTLAANVVLEGQLYPATIHPDGSWSAPINKGNLPDGTYYPVLVTTGPTGAITQTNLQPFTIDTTPANVVVTSNATALAAGETAQITFTLSEAVTDFTASDVTVSGGTLSGFAQSATNPLVYTATFTPAPGSTPGTATISVGSQQFSDAAGNLNTDGAEANNSVSLATGATVTGSLAPAADSGVPGDDLTNDKTPTLQGKVPAGASADVTIDGVSYPVTVDPSGNWTFTQPNNLPDGTYTPVLHVKQGGQTSSTPLDPFTIDTVPASVVLSSNTSTLAPGQPATLTFTFSEVVNGFTAADLTVTGGAVTGLTQSPTDPKVWTATFTPAATGTVATVTLPSGKFSDAAGNLNTDGADPNNTLTLLTNASVTGQLSPASDNATGVPNDNKTSDPTPELIGKVPAGSTATVTLAGQTYPVSVNPDGSYSFTPPVGLPDGTYTPVLNLTTAGVTSATPITPFTIDTVAPTVEVTASRTNLAGGLTAQLTFTLSEASTDFSVADIQSTGGTLSGFAQSATNPLVYTATFTPTTGAMSGQVSVASTTFSDAAGNLNKDGADANNSVDFVLRSVQSGGYNPGASATGELAPTSDTGEKGDGITNDPTPTIEGKVPAGSTATITLAGQTYPVEVNPDGSYNFTPPAGLPDGTYTPALNVTTNGVTTATPITPFTIDTTPPTIAISADKTQLLAGQTALITFTLSEEVSDFAAADIAVSGGTLSGFAQSSTDPKVYTATFTPSANSSANSVIRVASGEFSDAANNFNADGADANNTLSIPTNTLANGATAFLAPSSDSGTPGDATTNDNTPTLTGSVPPGATATMSVAGQIYPVTVNPDGTYSFTLPTGLPDGTYTPQITVTPTGGGAPVTSPGTPFTIDTTAPTVAITSSATSLVTGQTAPITFTLSEASSDFTLADVSVTGGTLSGLVQSATDPKVYTATFTPAAGRTAPSVISVASFKFSDAAGNFNADGSDANNTLTLPTNTTGPDAVAPTIAITADRTQLLTGQTALVTFTLSEASSDFTAADVTVSGGALSGFAQSSTDPKVYTATFTPSANSTANSVISVASGKFSDAAGNQNADGADANNTLSLPTNTSAGLITGALDPSSDTGKPGDNATVDTTPTISGTAPAGATVQVRIPAQNGQPEQVLTATADPDGQYSVNVPTGLLDGTYTPQITVTPTNGSPTTVQGTPFTIDTTPPTIAISASASTLAQGQTSTISFTLSEASSDFTLADVIVSGGTLSNFAGSGTSYSATFTPHANSTANGVISVASSKFADAAGNQNADGSDANNTVTLTVNTFNVSSAAPDTTPPAKPTTPSSYADNTGTTQSPATTAPVTDDTTPALNIGNVPTGETPSLYVDGVKVPATYDPVTGTLTPNSPLTEGPHQLAYSLTDPAGNESQPSNALPVTIDSTAPAKPAAPTTYADNSAPVTNPASTAPSTNDTTPGLNIGAVPTGTTPSLYVDGVKVPATYDPATGTLTPTTPLTEGPHQLAYSLTDPAGNESQPSNALPLTVDTQAPAAPASAPASYADNSAPVTNPASTAPTTNDTTPGLNIGTVPTGTTPSLYVDGVKVPATYDPATGTLTPNSPLPEGPHQVSYSLTDAAGNESAPSPAMPLTVDATPPTIAVSTNQSTLAANQTATITFTLSEASSDFTFADITVSGGTLGALTQSSTDPKVYTATYTPLTNSTTPVTISVASSKFADAAGNQNADGSDSNNTVTLSVNTAVVGAPPDTTAPAQPTAPSSYADNTGPVTSPASTAPSTDDTTPGINIGNVPAGETPSLYVDGVKVPATYDPATGTLTPDTPLTPGAHQLTYTLTDAAGNESVPSAAIPVTIDSTPPTIIVTSSVGSSTPLGSGQTATITFTLSDAASDFTLADISVSGGTLGALTQSSTDPKVYTATYTPLANSTTPVTISVASSKFSDAAGNLNTDGADTNNSVTLTVDTQAPAAPSTAPGSYGDNTGAQQNPTSSAPATDDTTPSLNIGTVPTGTTPSLYVDGVKVPATYNPSTGTLTPNSPLPEGAHQITYTLTDAAGNESAPSPAMPLTVDTTPPTIAISTNQSSLVNGQTATITFTLSEASSNFVWDGTTGDITVTGGTLGAITQSSTNPLVYTATFTPAANSTANGVISVASSKFSDAAGNQNTDGSDPNNTVTLTVNTLSVSSTPTPAQTNATATIDITSIVNAPVSAQSQDTGPSASDFVTSDQTLAYKGTITNWVDGQGDRVMLRLYDTSGSTPVLVTTAFATPDSAGNWLWNDTATTRSPGTYALEATIVSSTGTTALNSTAPTSTNGNLTGGGYDEQAIVIDTTAANTDVNLAVSITTDANNNGTVGSTELAGASTFTSRATFTNTGANAAKAGDTITLSDGTSSVSKVLTSTDISNGYVEATFAKPADGATQTVTAKYTDLAGNAATGTVSDAATLDATAPTITVVAATSPVGAGQGSNTSLITFTLSEASTDFVVGDVTVTGGTLGALTGSGTTYTATFTPDGTSASGTVSVANAKFSDAAGNQNADGAEANNTATIDINVAPVASSTSLSNPLDPNTGVTGKVTLAASGFTAAGVNVSPDDDGDAATQLVELKDGSYVVTWQNGSTARQIFNANGTQLYSTEQDVQLSPGNGSPNPEALKDGGYIVLSTSSSLGKAYLNRYDSAHQKINTIELNVDNSDVKIAALEDGGYVVTTRASNNSLYAQRYNASDAPVGGQILLSSGGTAGVDDVIAMPDGGYLVSWWKNDGVNAPNAYVQRYNSANAPVTAAVELNPAGTMSQAGSKLSTTTDGGYVVTWDAGVGNGADVYAQKFSASNVAGTLQTVTVTANTADQRPNVTSIEGGGYAVTWYSGNAIYAQVFPSTGAVTSSPVQLWTVNNAGQNDIEIESTTDGGFVVVGLGVEPTVTAGGPVYAQKFDNQGNKVGGQQSFGNGIGRNIDLITTSDGGYVVSWVQKRGSFYDTMVQDVDASGVPVGATGTGNFNISATLTGLEPTATVNSYVATFSSGTLTVGGTTYASGASIPKATWDAAVAANTVILSGASSTASGFALQASVTDSASSQTYTVPLSTSSSLGTASTATTSDAMTIQQLFGSTFTDANPTSASTTVDDFKGVAITSAGSSSDLSTKGKYQILVNGTWTDLGSALSDSSAVYVDKTTLVRFVSASGATGVVPQDLVVRLVDGYAVNANHVVGNTINVSTNGGMTAYSGNTVTLAMAPVADTTAPGIVVTTSAGYVGAGQGSNTATITFTLSEPSTTFDATDVVTTGGTLSGFTGSGTTYTATFTPTAGQTSGTVSVASAKFSDAAGNQNTDGAEANNTATIAINVAPVASSNTLANPTSLSEGPTATVSLAASGFVAAGLNLSPSGTDTDSVPSLVQLDNGNVVVTWDNLFGSSRQILDPNGVPLNASELAIGSGTYTQPVALKDGGYVVTVSTNSGAQRWLYRYDSNNQLVKSFQMTQVASDHDIVALEDGGYVVVSNGSSNVILAERFDSNDASLGVVTVNSAGNDAWVDEVIATPDGGYIVTWTRQPVSSSSVLDLFFQKYNSANAPVGNPVELNSGAALSQGSANWAITTDGNYVVTWVDRNTNDLAVQRFDANLTSLGTMQSLGAVTSVEDFKPDVAALTGGGFVVAWVSSSNSLSSGTTYVQRFNAAGTAVGAPTMLWQSTGSYSFEAQVVATADGGFVVLNKGVDTNSFGSPIYAQKFDSQGNLLGAQQTFGGPESREPTILATDDGGYVVAWIQRTSSSYYDPLVQKVDASGVPVGATGTGSFNITSTLTGLEPTATVNSYVATFTSGTLTVGGTTYASGASIPKATWDAAVAAKTVVLSGATASASGFTLVASVTDGGQTYTVPLAGGASKLATSQVMSIAELFGSTFTDANPASASTTVDDFMGVAITGAGSSTDLATRGKYQILVNGTWTDLGSTLSDTNAVYVDKTTLVRFVSTSDATTGMPQSLTARLVDGYAVTANHVVGSSINVSTNGGMTAYSSATLTLDADPTVAVTRESGSTGNFRGSEVIRFTFSEPVKAADFTTASIDVLGGTLNGLTPVASSGSVSTGYTQYTATFVPSGAGSVRIGVAAGKITDAAGNTNLDTYLAGVYQQDNNAVSGIMSPQAAPTVSLGITGENTDDWAGYSVSDAGDVNGDGLDDVIIGSRAKDATTGNFDGAAYVVFGTTGAMNINLDDVANGIGGFKIDGTSNTSFGYIARGTVNGGMDLNGDGLSDVVVDSNVAASTSNQAFVIYGKTDGTTVNLSSLSTAGQTHGMVINTSLSGFGSSTDVIGDFNGDGIDDLIFSAPDAGRAVVVFGKQSSTAIDVSNFTNGGTGGFVITGFSAGSNFRDVKVAGNGDVNGDGLDDIVIGDDRSNRAVVIFGSKQASYSNVAMSALGGSGFAITNGGTGSIGDDVAILGDVNGDGLADIGVTNTNGLSYVVYGKASTTDVAVSATTSASAGLVFNAKLPSDTLEVSSATDHALVTSIKSAGDFNGDGLDDLFVGVPMANNSNGANTGRAYVIYGRSDAKVIEASSLAASDGFAVPNLFMNTGVTSGTGYQGIGDPISPAGDVNGDGFDDLVAGIYYNGTNPAMTQPYAEGKTYIIYGGQYGASGTVAVDFLGSTGNDTLTGTTANEQMVADRGDDTLVGGGGADVMSGGAGNDTFVLNADNVAKLAQTTGNTAGAIARIHGGTGLDTVRLSGSGITLDLQTIRNEAMGEVEHIDLTGSGANTIRLNLTDVVHLGSSNVFNVNTSATDVRRQLMVSGGADDVVQLEDAAEWTRLTTTFSYNGGTYVVYNHNTANAQLLVQQAVQMPGGTLSLNVGAQASSFAATPTVYGDAFRDVVPEIVPTTNGGYVITWRDEVSAEAYNTVYQLFDANHQPVGSKVIVGNWGSGGEPSIAATADGGFVLVNGNGFQNLTVTRFDSSGTQVATTTLNPANTYNVNADITVLSDGGYAVSWTNLSDIYIQRFSSSNTLVGTTKVIDGASTSDREPEIVATPDGGYVVVWTASPATNIFVQKFGADNNAMGPETALDNPNGGADQRPVVAVLTDGSYVVAWDWWPNNGQGNVYAQKFSSNGSTSGSMITLTGPNGNAQWDLTPTITALSDGGYVVAWEGYIGTGYTDILIQRFDKNNVAVGAMKQLQGDNNADANPNITATTDGGYVVVWEGIGTATNNTNIFIQKFGSDNNPVGDKRMIFGHGDGSNQNDQWPKVAATPGGGYVVTWQGASGASYGIDIFVEAFDGSGIPAGATGNGTFNITSSLLNLPAGQTVTSYVVTYPSGSLTVGGTAYASGATVPQATWDAAVAANTVLLTGASATNYSVTLVANVNDTLTGQSFQLTVNRMGTGLVSPLAIDLNGDGVQTLGLDQGVAFDLSGSGTKVQTGWVDRHDGLLAMDLNHDGLINSGAELFGNGTLLANGNKADDGWAALAGLDSNADGLINALDAQFANLRVWRDADTDGVTDAGELLSLADAGIASISLAHDASVTAQNGNLLSGKAVVTHTDGSTTDVTDAWLATEDLHTVPVTIDLSQVIHGNLADLTNARAEVLQIKVNDLLQLPSTAAGEHQVEVLGDAVDTVKLDSLLVNGQPSGTWSQAGAVAQNGHMFNVYQYSGDQSLQVLIDQHIAQSNVHLS